MGTKEFNTLDKIISWTRLHRVLPYIDKDDSVLDFGCGYQAYLLRQIKGRIKKGIGVDYDLENGKIEPNITLRKFKFVNKLPFVDKSFDTIFLLAVIEHIEIHRVSTLLKELKRILKPGGKIILTTPTSWGKVILEFLAFRLGIISKEEVGDHKRYYTRENLEEYAKRHNLKMEKYLTFQFGGNALCVLSKK